MDMARGRRVYYSMNSLFPGPCPEPDSKKTELPKNQFHNFFGGLSFMSAPFRIPLLLIAALLFTMLLPVPSGARVYTFVDEKGGIHFTNVPSDRRYKPLFYERSDKGAIDSHIQRAARKYSVDPLLVKAVIQAESNFNHLAISRKGAKGLMQLMPETCLDMNVSDPFDPADNIRGGTRYLRLMLNAFEGDLHLAIAAYNAGPEQVRKYGRIPPFPETQAYVKNVLDTYRRLQNNPSLALY